MKEAGELAAMESEDSSKQLENGGNNQQNEDGNISADRQFD